MTTKTTGQHTPGPWEITKSGTIFNRLEGYGNIGILNGAAEADARLIAAAPSLLSILKAIVRAKEENGIDIPCCYINEAKAAIEAATKGK